MSKCCVICVGRNADRAADRIEAQKSINCQARAVAIYVALQKTALFNSLKSKDSWITFHERHVKG